MTAQEAYLLIEELRFVFDIVRLVDVERTVVCNLEKDGTLTEEPVECFVIWHKDRRCENCISSKACESKPRIEKFEFIDSEVYHVTSRYVNIDGRKFALEIVSKTTDETLFEAYGKDEFIHAIEKMNKRIYVDQLTEVYNRRYYEEQIVHLLNRNALAMIDMDDFKSINDTYGHLAGDVALKTVAQVLKRNVRNSDSVIRYGGDEFLIAFADIPKEIFEDRLEEIRNEVEKIQFMEYPNLHLTVSIGGKFKREDMEELFIDADRLLYKAKEQKNKVLIE